MFPSAEDVRRFAKVALILRAGRGGSNPAPGRQVHADAVDFWGLPAGTTITPGMRRLTAAQREQFQALSPEQRTRYFEARRTGTHAAALKAVKPAPVKAAKKAAPAKPRTKAEKIEAASARSGVRVGGKVVVPPGTAGASGGATGTVRRIDLFRDEPVVFVRSDDGRDVLVRLDAVRPTGETGPVPARAVTRPTVEGHGAGDRVSYRPAGVSQARTGTVTSATPRRGQPSGLVTVQFDDTGKRERVNAASLAVTSTPAPTKATPASVSDRRIAEAERRAAATRERAGRAQAAHAAAARRAEDPVLAEHFPLGTGGAHGGRPGASDAQLRKFVETRKAAEAAQGKARRAERQATELAARRDAAGKYSRDTVTVGDYIKVDGTWERVLKANDKTVQVDAGRGMDVRYRWDRVTDHRTAESVISVAADRANLTGTERSDFIAWAKRNPGKTVADWRAQRRAA